MAADGWRGDASVRDRLFAEGYRFDFFQAVSLLERMAAAAAKDAGRPAPPSVGEGSSARAEAVCFGASVGFGFTPSDVIAVREAGEGAPAEMTVAFLSLVGGLGPMPEPIADIVQRATVTSDFGPSDFLDIFHHRLVSLRYRIKRQHRPAVAGRAPEETHAAAYLFALFGLFQPPLRAGLAVAGRPLLHYAGLLAGERRSMAALTAILRHRFGVPVEGVPLTGAFRPIEPADRTRIGRSGANRRIGDSAVIGRRVWDHTAAFELRVGPLSHDQLLRFLPGTKDIPTGDMLAPFCEIVRFYAGPGRAYTLRLAYAPRPGPQARIGRSGNRPRLGYTAWIGDEACAAHPPAPEIRLLPGELPAAIS